MRRNCASGRRPVDPLSLWFLWFATLAATATAAAKEAQQLECFAVDFDGDNNNARTNDNPDFIKCGGASASAIKGMVEDPAVAHEEMIHGYCQPLTDGGGFTYETLYFQANDLKKELPRYQRNLARYEGADVKIVWGRHDPFLSASSQLDQFKQLLDVGDDDVLVLESAGHLIADEAPEAILRFIR